MKVKIEIQQHTLELLCRMYEAVKEYAVLHPAEISFTRDYRAVKSIIDLLMVKLQKKNIDKRTTKKPFKLTFEYYQAFFLKQFIVANHTFIHGVFEQNLLLQLHNKLDAEL